MNNTNQQLYVIYKNTQSFYNYRNLISLDDELSQEQFIKLIQKDKYMLLSSIDKSFVIDDEGTVDSTKLKHVKEQISNYNEKSKNTDITITNILLIYPGTECESKRMNMMKLVNHIRFPRANVLIITPSKVTSSVAKGLQSISSNREHTGHDFKVFTYSLLNSVLPEHELVPKYEILNDEQVSQLKNWNIDIEMLPKIFENDPQMVWIGAKVGQVIKFTCISEVTIETIGYSIVISSML